VGGRGAILERYKNKAHLKLLNSVISSSASNPQRNGTESSNLKVQRSVAVFNNIQGLYTDILVALVVIIMCYL